MLPTNDMQGLRHRQVVFVCEVLLGGIREHILQLLFGLKERGWNVCLFFGGDRADPEFLAARQQLHAAGVETHSLPMKRNPVSPSNLVAVFRLAGMLRQLQPDLVHAHCAIGGAVGRIAARLAGAKKALYSPHGGSLHHQAGFASWLYGVVERVLARRTQVIILISEWLRSRCAEVVGCPSERMIVVPIGIEITQFPMPGAADRAFARKLLGADPRAIVFLCVGLLRPIKGQDILIRAFRHVLDRNPEARLVLVGEGESRGEMESLAGRLGIQAAVQFTGFVKDVRPFLRAADVYVHPTRGDASSYSIMEAMACGLPVIASRVAAIPEIVVDGLTGLLVLPENPLAMADAMHWLAQRPEQRLSLGNAGRERVQNCFPVEEMIRRTEQVYLRCLGVESQPTEVAVRELSL